MRVAIVVTAVAGCVLVAVLFAMTSERDWEVPIMATQFFSMAATLVAVTA